MKLICATIWASVFLFKVASLQAQFAPSQYAANDKFEIQPLTTSATVKLKALYTLSADNIINTGMNAVEDAKSKIIELRIFDVNGIMFFRKILKEDFQEYDIDLSTFAAGAYVVEVRQGMDILSTKVIRRHH